MILKYIAAVLDAVMIFIILIGANKEENWKSAKYGYYLFLFIYLMNIVALIEK